MSCQFTSCYDVTKTYPLLSQLAGILAGFAFSGLIMMLGVIVVSRKQFERKLDQVGAFTGTLFLASLGLGFASYNYLFIGGEEQIKGRALSEGLFADAAMTLATVLLPLAILQLVEFADLERWVPFLRASVIVLPLFYYAVLVPDAAYLEDTKVVHGGPGLPTAVPYALTLLMVAIGGIGGWRRRVHWRSRSIWLSAALFGFATSMTVAMQVVNAQGSEYVSPANVQAIVFVLAAVILGCVIAFVVSTRGAKPEKTDRRVGAQSPRIRTMNTDDLPTNARRGGRSN